MGPVWKIDGTTTYINYVSDGVLSSGDITYNTDINGKLITMTYGWDLINPIYNAIQYFTGDTSGIDKIYDYVSFGRVTNSTSIINIMNTNGLAITARK
jgi:hypothetical protein